MYELGPGILPNSICVPLTATAKAKELYFYPVLCGHYYCDDKYEVSRMRYDNPLLLFVRSGTMCLRYDGADYRAEKGDVLLIDCDRPHRYAAEGQVEMLYLHFDGCNAHALARALSADSPVLRREENVLIGQRLYDMVQDYRRHGLRSEAEDSMRMYQLLIWLSLPAGRPARSSDPINQTVEYIRQHVGETITLRELADMAHLSACHYSHEFKRQTGFSPMEYVINTRIEKAKMLLLQTTMTVMDIAYEVGYESGGSLSNLFLKKTGCSPREYRRSNGITAG
ncbi:MAG: AraC family transcriptional regulator [Eubacteriales bacterium]|nr:AraC family transcriptional regulator [Eubacteriales bacterium]